MVPEQRIPLLLRWRDTVLDQMGVTRPASELTPAHLTSPRLDLRTGETAGLVVTGIPTQTLAETMKGGFTLWTGTPYDGRPGTVIKEIPFALLP